MLRPIDVKEFMGTCATCKNWDKDTYNGSVGGRCKKLIEEHWSEIDADYILVERWTENDFFCAYFESKENMR